MAPGTGVRERAGGLLAALEVPNYRLLFAGRVTSNMGRFMRSFARGWLVYQLTGSPLRMGIAFSAISWPMLFMPLVAGVVADRVDRKQLLLWTEGLLVLLWAAVALLISLGLFQWWYFIITAFTSGMIQSFGRTGHQAMIGSVVDRERLGNAVALDSVSQTWPQIGGPALGAVLVGVIGTGGVFWATAVLQLVTFATLVRIRWEPTEQQAPKESVGKSVLEALRYIRGETVIVALVMLGLFSSLFAGSYHFMLPIFADDILGAGAHGLGALLIAIAVGGAMGSVVALAISNVRRSRGLLLMAMVAVTTVVLITFSLSELLLLSLVAMFGLGASRIIFMTIVTINMQQFAPDHLRGRIMSLWVVSHGLSPVGVLIMGAVAELRGAANTLLLAGVLYGVSAMLVFLVVPGLRRFQ